MVPYIYCLFSTKPIAMAAEEIERVSKLQRLVFWIVVHLPYTHLMKFLIPYILSFSIQIKVSGQCRIKCPDQFSREIPDNEKKKEK